MSEHELQISLEPNKTGEEETVSCPSCETPYPKTGKVMCPTCGLCITC